MRLPATELSDKFAATTAGSSIALVLIMIAGRFGVALSQTEAAAIVTVAAMVCCWLKEEKVFQRLERRRQLERLK